MINTTVDIIIAIVAVVAIIAILGWRRAERDRDMPENRGDLD